MSMLPNLEVSNNCFYNQRKHTQNTSCDPKTKYKYLARVSMVWLTVDTPMLNTDATTFSFSCDTAEEHGTLCNKMQPAVGAWRSIFCAFDQSTGLEANGDIDSQKIMKTSSDGNLV